MKYAIVKVNSCEMSIMFPDPILHRTFEYLNPISAGKCKLFVKEGKIECQVWGESISLKLKSRPEDKDIILHGLEFEG